ncbi:MAG: RNA-binding protein [Chloroflexota bacterium]
MATKLYVGNLSYDTTDNSLRTLFEQAGAVEEATVIQDRDSGRSKGFAFVTMADAAGASAAISQLNGAQLDGRALKVAEAKPREPRSNSYGGGGGGGGGSRRW